MILVFSLPIPNPSLILKSDLMSVILLSWLQRLLLYRIYLPICLPISLASFICLRSLLPLVSVSHLSCLLFLSPISLAFCFCLPISLASCFCLQPSCFCPPSLLHLVSVSRLSCLLFLSSRISFILFLSPVSLASSIYLHCLSCLSILHISLISFWLFICLCIFLIVPPSFLKSYCKLFYISLLLCLFCPHSFYCHFHLFPFFLFSLS